MVEDGGAHLRQVLGALNEAQRAVITLRVLADLSVEETARVLGRSPGSVKQLQRRGLAVLRDILAGHTDGANDGGRV